MLIFRSNSTVISTFHCLYHAAHLRNCYFGNLSRIISGHDERSFSGMKLNVNVNTVSGCIFNGNAKYASQCEQASSLCQVRVDDKNNVCPMHTVSQVASVLACKFNEKQQWFWCGRMRGGAETLQCAESAKNQHNTWALKPQAHPCVCTNITLFFLRWI